MKENNILDDLQFDEKEKNFSGTNTQLLRGLFFSVLIQFGLWGLLFKLMNSNREDEIFIDKTLINIEFLNYELNIILILVFLILLIGALSLVFLANAKHQTYKKITIIGLLFSFCTCIEIAILQSFENNRTWYKTLLDFYFENTMLISFQFVLFLGLLFIAKNKWTVIALIFIIAVFLGMGFIK